MKKLILILAIAAFSVALFGQTENLNDITGLNPPQLHTSDAEIVLDITDCNGKVHYNEDADAIAFKLPPAQAGLVVAFGAAYAGVITVDVFDGVDEIYINGIAGGAGNAMASDGSVGLYIVLHCKDNTIWWALPVVVDTWGIP